MRIPEYGRHVHKLVEYCKTLEDKQERNKLAKAIIDVMGNMQPQLRDVIDFQHKLWDQLFIMADYDLDVDSPYEITPRELLNKKPPKLPYPDSPSKFKYYGHNIQSLIKVALDWEEGEMKDKLIYAIANHMKKCYLMWNRDTVTDHIIRGHLLELSHQGLDIDVDQNPLQDASKLLAGFKKTNNKSKKKKKKYKKY
jgi:hypothetical protein